MIFPLRRRRLIDLRSSLARARDNGTQDGIAIGSATIETLLDQLAQMTEQIAALRETFRIDLAAVCAELRATKLELHRLQTIDRFAALEHRDLNERLH